MECACEMQSPGMASIEPQAHGCAISGNDVFV